MIQNPTVADLIAILSKFNKTDGLLIKEGQQDVKTHGLPVVSLDWHCPSTRENAEYTVVTMIRSDKRVFDITRMLPPTVEKEFRKMLDSKQHINRFVEDMIADARRKVGE